MKDEQVVCLVWWCEAVVGMMVETVVGAGVAGVAVVILILV